MNTLASENIKYKASKFIILAISIGASIFIPNVSEWVIGYLKELGVQKEIPLVLINIVLFIILLIIVFLLDNFVDRRSIYGEFHVFVEKLTTSNKDVHEVNSNYAKQLEKIEDVMDKLHIEKLNSIREHSSKLPEDASRQLEKFIRHCRDKELVKKNKISEFNEEIDNLSEIIVHLTRLDSIVEKRIINISSVNAEDDVV